MSEPPQSQQIAVQPINPQPPKGFYKPSKHEAIRESIGYLLEKVERPAEGGIYMTYRDIPARRKGWPTMQSSETVNIVKKFTLVIFSNPWLLLFKKNRERYLNLVDWIMDNPFKSFLEDHSH